MATGYALLKNRTDDSSVYQIPAASRRDRPAPKRHWINLSRFYDVFVAQSKLGRYPIVLFSLGESSRDLQTICWCNCVFHLGVTSSCPNHRTGFKQPFRQSHRTKNHEQSNRHRWHLP